jgi:uncharacterized membrane protein
MPDPAALIAPWLTPGVTLAIAAMAAATYLCRIGGYYLMHLVPLTGRLKRAFMALPGCIIAAAVLPIVDRLGSAAALAIGAAVLTMLIRRSEILALVVGLAAGATARAYGL